jgi:hypothetical protein
MATVRETARPHPGRQFEPIQELPLVEVALAACSKLPNAHRGLLVIRELVGPIGIPDLTAVVGDGLPLQKRLELPIPPLLNRIDAAVVAAAHTRTASSVDELARRNGWPIQTVARRIPRLLKSGALIESRRSGQLTRPSALAPVGRIYAIEAKVRDWRKGIRQARAYSVWADSYVLVMGPLQMKPLSELLNQVDEDRGGLIVGGEWKRRPFLKETIKANRLWASEHVIAAIPPHQPSVAP